MGVKEEEFWLQSVPLREAWLDFADHIWPGAGREAELRSLWRGRDDETPEDTDQRLHQAEHFEKGLKRELIDEIAFGRLKAFGRDISNSLGDPIVALPAGLFDHAVSDLEVNWDDSSVVSYGRKIIEVRITPAALREDDAPKSKGGRPSKRDPLEKACRIAMKQDPKFCSLQTKQAIPVIENILKTTLKTTKGFEGGVNEETLRRAKKAVCKN